MLSQHMHVGLDPVYIMGLVRRPINGKCAGLLVNRNTLFHAIIFREHYKN